MVFNDNTDRMVALLEAIAENTGSLDRPDKEINLNGQSADGRVGLVPAGSILILETDNLDPEKQPLQTNGTVELSPGDSVPLVNYDVGEPAGIHALGAIDQTDVEYELKVDRKTVGGRTSSPLGVLNDPFSFVDTFGGVVPAEDRAEYIAHYSTDATGTIELAGRMFIEVL